MHSHRWWRLAHLYLGLSAGLILAANGLAGTALAFRQELARAFYPGIATVEPRPQHAAVQAGLEAAQAYLPDAPLRYFRQPQTPTDPLEVVFAGPAAQADIHLLVDPYSGQVIGPHPMPLLQTLFDWHVHLLAGDAGKTVIGILGLLLIVSCISGIVLWWPRRRRPRQLVTVTLNRGWRRAFYELHGATGFILSAALLLTAITGSGMVFRQQVDKAASLLDAAPFMLAAPALPPDTPLRGKPALPADRFLTAAQAVFPDGRITYVTPPARPAQPWTVRLKRPAELHQNGRTYVWLDPADAAVLKVLDGPAMPAANRWLDHALYPLHTGVAFAFPGRLLVAFLGLTPALFLLTGAALWIARLRRRPSP